jgi:glycosyltransferase involved in cell wall biosynthesis
MIEETSIQKNEVDRLVQYLTKDGKPDVIHLSNALILGLARQLKNRLDTRIVCSLLNEDDWVDEMAEPYRSKAWEMIGREAVHVDKFITPSNYYKELFLKRTGLKGDNIHVVPLGFDPEILPDRPESTRPPALGYFCRINKQNGFDKLTDAFIKLKSANLLPDLILNVCGGYTGDDKPFIARAD